MRLGRVPLGSPFAPDERSTPSNACARLSDCNSTEGANMSHRTHAGSARANGAKGKWAFTSASVAIAALAALTPAPASAVGRLGNLEIVTRSDGQVLPVYPSGGRNWVVGAPGQEYSIRFCNTSPGRVLAVMSVDGVNAISGDTASPWQSGYVLNGYECTDINGWRKSMSRTAAFYFTELPDAYATRTGRPENVGVIGVAVFRERVPATMWRQPADRIANEARRDAPAAPQESPAAAESSRQEAAGVLSADAARSAPAPASKLGTGHGRSEDSYAQYVRFERESATPNETIAIHYDRRENLVAMGILPPPTIARTPNPFPAWPRFVQDPPNR